MNFRLRLKRILTLTLTVLIIISCLSACGKSKKLDDNTITVALFPYVPNLDAMKSLLVDQWSRISPDTQLSFVDWDCYYDDSPDNIDVFMYDALFLDYFVESGYVHEIKASDINDIDGIIDCALEGALYDGKYYGVPALMCSNFLFYYKDDTELAEVENVQQLYEVVGDRKTKDKKPADKTEGLIINFYDNFTYYYLETLVDEAGKHLDFKESPDLDSTSDSAINTLKYFAKMSGQEDVLISTLSEYIYGSFGKAEWFNEGCGRCSFGYSENMSFMPDIIDDIEIKTISMSDKDNVQVFYADFLSINKKCVTDSKKFDECMKLINLISGEEFLKSLTISDGTTQYLLPAREAVYDYAGETFPMYNRLKELAISDNNAICRFGTDIYKFQTDSFTKIAMKLG